MATKEKRVVARIGMPVKLSALSGLLVALKKAYPNAEVHEKDGEWLIFEVEIAETGEQS